MRPSTGRFFSAGLPTKPLDGLYAVAQPSKVVEGLNLHGFRSRRNSDNEDLVLVPLHSLVDVCEMDEVVLRDQGIFAAGLMVDGY
jgi:hypothetical protein